MAEGLEKFLTRYPMDEFARECLIGRSVEIQAKVIEGFAPRTEGASDYSALVMAYLRKFKVGKSNEGGRGKPWDARKQEGQEWAARNWKRWGPEDKRPEGAPAGWGGWETLVEDLAEVRGAWPEGSRVTEEEGLAGARR